VPFGTAVPEGSRNMRPVAQPRIRETLHDWYRWNSARVAVTSEAGEVLAGGAPDAEGLGSPQDFAKEKLSNHQSGGASEEEGREGEADH